MGSAAHNSLNVEPGPPVGTDTGQLGRALAILQEVADRGGATAKAVSKALGIPLPTVYRLLQELVRCGYLVHLRRDQRYELGYRLHGLGVALHQQVGVPPRVRQVIDELHQDSETAAYFAVYRGVDVILAYVSDCPKHRRSGPLDFGFHEAAHATAFGKVMLAGMSPEDRREYLQARGMQRFTPATIVDLDQIEAELESVALRGIAWESAELLPGMACGAVPVHGLSGAIIGAIAVSTTPLDLQLRRRVLDHRLRSHASQVSRHLRAQQRPSSPGEPQRQGAVATGALVTGCGESRIPKAKPVSDSRHKANFA